MGSKKLEELRAQVDAIDRQIVEALGERGKLVREIAASKAAAKTPFQDREREAAQLARLDAIAEQRGVSGYLVRRLFREILDHALRLQHERQISYANTGRRGRKLIVAFQGAV